MNKKVVGVIVAAAIGLLVCAGAATLDSCKRHNKSCFGSTSNR